MPEVKLTAEEADVLRAVLARLAVRSRTGEVGIVHGVERFVSTQHVLRKADRDLLESLARKLGLPGVRSVAS